MKKMFLVLGLLLFPHSIYAQGSNQGVGPQSNQNIGPGDCSTTITTGGTAQVMLAAKTNRKGFQVLNFDTTEPLWISFTGTATANAIGSYPIPAATASTFAGAGSYYSNIGFNTNISIIGATTGHKFSCTNW